MKPRPSRSRPAPRPPARGKQLRKQTENQESHTRAALELFAKQGFYRTTTKAVSTNGPASPRGRSSTISRPRRPGALFLGAGAGRGLTAWFEGEVQAAEGAPLAGEALCDHSPSLGTGRAAYEEFIQALPAGAGSPPRSSARSVCSPRRTTSVTCGSFARVLAEAEADGEIPKVGGTWERTLSGCFTWPSSPTGCKTARGGKEDTLALLDRCLKLATTCCRKGGWEW